LHDRGDIHLWLRLLEQVVERRDGVLLRLEREDAGIWEQAAKTIEHILGQNLERLLVLRGCAHGVLRVQQFRPGFLALFGAHQSIQVIVNRSQMRLDFVDGSRVLGECLHFIEQGVSLRRTLIALAIRGKRLPQALEHAVVVDDEAVLLVRCHPVHARNRLHQGVALHRLVQVQRRQ
jgi:hypothetical protein